MMILPSWRVQAVDWRASAAMYLAVLGLLVGSWTVLAPDAVAQRSTPTEAHSFAEAVELYEQKLFGAAASAFASFRQQHPNHVNAAQALFLEAKAMLALERQDEAVRLFRQLFERYPNHPKAEEAQLQLAQYFLEEGEIEQGREQLRSVLEAVPNSPLAARALYQLGTTEQEQDNLETALSHFGRVVDEYPDSDVAPAALYTSAAIQVELQRYEAAASSYEALSNRYPQSAFAENVGTALAEVYYRLGQYDPAITELRRRLSELSGDSRTRGLFFIAESLHQLGQYEAARARYQQLLNEFPTSPYVPSAHYGTGWTHHHQDDYGAAADAFARAREGAEDSLAVKATYYEAVNRSLNGQSETARSLHQTLVKQWPESDLADASQFEIGLLHYQDGAYEASITAFEQLLDRYPNSDRVGEAYYWLGNAYLATDALDRAEEAYSSAEERGTVPDSVQTEVQFQKAWTLYQQERYDDAASLFLSIIENDQASTRSSDALFWAADCFYETGDRSRAQDLFQRYLENYPNGEHAPAAQYSLAWTYFEQQRYQSAARSFDRFLRSTRNIQSEVPYRSDAQLRLADSHYALKQYGEAISAYRAVQGEGEDYAFYQRGQALNFAGQPERAIETFQQLANQFPNSPWQADALYRMGFIHLQQQNYERARQAYRRVLNQHPDSPIAAKAQYGIGDTYYNAGNMQAAQQEYQEVLTNYPDSPLIDDAASSLFFALNARGEDDRADAVIDSFAAENPNSDIVSALRFRRAEASYQTGDLQKAQRLFQEFLRTSQNETLIPEAYYYLGVIYGDRNQPSEAATYLQQILDQYPGSPRRAEAALRLGDIRLNQERYEAAAEAYRMAAEIPGLDEELLAQARYGQSVALLQQDNPEQARKLLERIVDANRGGPLLASARLGLARIHERQGRTSQAISLYRTVVDQVQSETGAEALYRLGSLLLEQDRPQEAIRELERMTALFGGYPTWIARSFLQQAQAYRQLGQPGEASRLYDRVIQEHAGTRFAETARQEKSSL